MPTLPNPEDPRPWLLLDVDGVLNAINNSQNLKTYDIHHVQHFRIRIPKRVPDWLFELTGYFVPTWATMWNDLANDHLVDFLGMPELPVIHCEYSLAGRLDGLHDKITCIENQVPGDQPFAWLDDEIKKVDLDWAYLRTTRGVPTKLIQVHPGMGLQQHHVNKLITWAKELS